MKDELNTKLYLRLAALMVGCNWRVGGCGPGEAAGGNGSLVGTKSGGLWRGSPEHGR